MLCKNNIHMFVLMVSGAYRQP